MKIDDTISLQQGEYRLVKELARGGQGTIWKVVGDDNKHYAMKVVNLYNIDNARRTLHNKAQMERLIYYAKAEIDFLTSLDNSLTKHIVTCLDHGIILKKGYELPAFIMPLYRQEDLSERIKFLRNHGKQIDSKLWLRWFQQLALALQSMQIASKKDSLLVHRDLKPSNCLLDENDDLLLIDFGIVRASCKTGTTSIVYSYDYCAPEQRLVHYVKNHTPHYYITSALDVYSAAMVMHEIIVGGTRAQAELNDDSTKWSHESVIHKLTEKPNGKVGLLGEIGGLTKQEFDNLVHTLTDLFKPQNSKKTVAIHQPVLPNYKLIATDFAKLINNMLAPWPDDRPNIDVILQTLEQKKACLKPELKKFQLKKDNFTALIGHEFSIDIEIEGTGLPAPNKWLQIKLNQSPLEKLKITHISDQTYRLDLPAFNELKQNSLKLSALVNNKDYTANAIINVDPDSNYLWTMNKRVDALKMELRKEWLDQWESEANDIEKKYQFLSVLKDLQQVYPDQANQLQQRHERINTPTSPLVNLWEKGKSFTPPKKPALKSWARKKSGVVILSFLIMLFIIVIGWLMGWFDSSSNTTFPDNPKETSLNFPDLSPIKKKFTSTDLESQREGWKELQNIIAQHNDYSEALKLKKQYEQQTLDWNAKDEKSSLRELALSRLQAMAEAGEKNAQYWLAIRYFEGDGIKKDRSKGIYWTKKAADQGVENAIITLDYIKNAK